MTSSYDKAIVKDMRLASLEVLRKTARDVFEEKIVGSYLTREASQNGTEEIISNDTKRKEEMNGIHSENYDDITDDDGYSLGLLKIDERDLVQGRVLGRGTFCVVQECTYSTFSLDADKNYTKKKGKSLGNYMRQFVGRRKRVNGSCIESASGTNSASTSGSNHDIKYHPTKRLSGSTSRNRYVMKQLSSDLKRADKINFLKGTVDLAMETRFLASLNHKNIICIKGLSSKDAFSDGYFIVLEKINETLARRVKGWMDIDRQCKGITGVFTGSKKKARRLQLERMSAACDLVSGMDYLHRRNVVFRDLKPDNIGFSFEGILKIFDFGLAKELRDTDRNKDGLYNLTGCTGSIRYMSPENIQGRPYNLKTDVYSWAMIMWNILALEPPFALYTEQMIIDRVCSRGYRPKIFSTWSARMAKIIGRSWSADIKERPNFSEISSQLKLESDEIDAMNAVTDGCAE
mmetsp:Transcript_18241/g.41855  ORF Transcript_18241/g.41855 Transcript_18241/m.41855 type:complete len:461 (+) Transcript_18241:165-1547(+)